MKRPPFPASDARSYELAVTANSLITLLSTFRAKAEKREALKASQKILKTFSMNYSGRPKGCGWRLAFRRAGGLPSNGGNVFRVPLFLRQPGIKKWAAGIILPLDANQGIHLS